MAAPIGQVRRPLLESREAVWPVARGPLCSEEDGTSPMGEETPQVAIAALADPSEVPTSPGGRFSRREAQPTREVPSAGKGVNVRDGSNERRRSDHPDAGDLLQSRRDRVFVRDLR